MLLDSVSLMDKEHGKGLLFVICQWVFVILLNLVFIVLIANIWLSILNVFTILFTLQFRARNILNTKPILC